MASILQVKGRWRAQVRRKGWPVYTKTFPTKAAAEKWARTIEADIDAGVLPGAAAVAARRYTVADLIEDYRRLRAQSRPVLDTTTEHYNLRRLAYPCFG